MQIAAPPDPVPNTPLPQDQTLSYVHGDLLSAMSAVPPGQPMSFVARITGIKEAHLAQRDETQTGYPHAVFLADREGIRPIEALPISDMNLLRSAQDFLQRGVPLIATGRYVQQAISRNKARLRFQLESLSPNPTVLQILGASPSEVTEAEATLAALTAKKPDGSQAPAHAIEDHLLDELTAIHHTARKNLSMRLRKAHRLVLLQGLSEGQVGPGVNPRLSVCFISDPGQGKGVLARYAETLAPVCTVVNPALVTAPGLSVRMEQKANQGWTAQPGATAKASYGTCIGHDLHRQSKSQMNTFEAIFMSTAEEGTIKPAKVVDTPYDARCALHLNGNPRHIIEGTPCPKGPLARLHDLSLPLDLFTRIDVVVHLPADGIEALADEMATRNLPHLSKDEVQALADRQRRLKVFVGLLRDRIPNVDFSQVQEPLGRLQEQLRIITEEHGAQLAHIEEGTFPPEALYLRMSKALCKLVAAAARLRGSSIADVSDVEIAGEMLALKLEVVRWVCGTHRTPSPLGGLDGQFRLAEATRDVRRHSILEKFGGEGLVDTLTIAERLSTGLRTIDRDLREMGIAANGAQSDHYLIPLLLHYEQKQAEGHYPPIQIADTEAPPPLPAGAAHRFYDSLGKVPPVLKRLSDELDQSSENLRFQLTKFLLHLALTPELNFEDEMHIDCLFRYFNKDRDGDARQYDKQLFYALMRAFRGTFHKWEERCQLALVLYGSIPEIRECNDVLEDALKQRTDLPLPIRRHIQSAISRRQFIKQNQGQQLIAA